MNILFAGGGTGGHVYPALAVIEQLRREFRDIKIGYVGTNRGLESRVIPREPDIEYFEIEAAGLERKPSVSALKSALRNAKGFGQSLRVIEQFKPELIVGTGGYVSFMPLLWGSLLKIPTLIHEQNAIPGLVNRVLAPLVDTVLTSFPRTELPETTRNIVHSGLPLRSSFVNRKRDLDSDRAKRMLNLDPARPLVMLMGGTHGASSIHDEMLSHYQPLGSTGTQVVVLAGRDAERLQSRISRREYPDLRVLGHTNDVVSWMSAADLLVCRAGASTLAEMTAMGLPAIVIPWSDAAHNHQEKNADALAQSGACVMLSEQSCANGQLTQEILSLLSNKSKLEQLSEAALRFSKQDAAERVVEEVSEHLHHGTTREALPLYRYWRRWNERTGMAPPSTGTFRHRFGL